MKVVLLCLIATLSTGCAAGGVLILGKPGMTKAETVSMQALTSNNKAYAICYERKQYPKEGTTCFRVSGTYKVIK